MRISACERNQHGSQSRENVTFWTKKQLKMAEFQLVQVRIVGKRSVQKLHKWTIPCLVFGHFSGGTVAGL